MIFVNDLKKNLWYHSPNDNLLMQWMHLYIHLIFILQISLVPGDDCIVLDNSDQDKWQVCNKDNIFCREGVCNDCSKEKYLQEGDKCNV